MTISDEVHLRHMTVDEALIKLDEYIHEAYMSGLSSVKVVHGKGTGTLRVMVDRELSRHPLVSSYRRGRKGEGGVGVTVVEFTSK